MLLSPTSYPGESWESIPFLPSHHYEYLLLYYNRLSRDMPECAVPSIMQLRRINPDPLPHAHHCPNPYCTYCTSQLARLQ